MNLSTVTGLVLALAAMAGSTLMEGGELSAFLNAPAILIVFGGTFAALLISFPGNRSSRLPGLIGRTFVHKSPEPDRVSRTLLRLSERARREGLLALEEELGEIDDPLLRRGVTLVIDGTDPELVKGVLMSEMGVKEQDHEADVAMLEAMGGYAPTMGIIGTVMGLVHVLGSLSDPSKLGGAIAVAFIATFYGVSTANILWLPMAAKLKQQGEAERRMEEMILEGLISIQSGENPRILQERLAPYVGHSKASAKESEPAGKAEEDLQMSRA